MGLKCWRFYSNVSDTTLKAVSYTHLVPFVRAMLTSNCLNADVKVRNVQIVIVAAIIGILILNNVVTADVYKRQPFQTELSFYSVFLFCLYSLLSYIKISCYLEYFYYNFIISVRLYPALYAEDIHLSTVLMLLFTREFDTLRQLRCV